MGDKTKNSFIGQLPIRNLEQGNNNSHISKNTKEVQGNIKGEVGKTLAKTLLD